jgi:hypothetical protein
MALGTGAIMWNERKMPARWYDLLRARIQVEKEHMRVIKEASLLKMTAWRSY